MYLTIWPQKYIKQKLIEVKVEIDELTTIVRDFNILLSVLDRTKQKINRETEDLNNIINKQELTFLQDTPPNRNRIHILLKHT